MSPAGWKAWRERRRHPGGPETDMSFLEHLEELRRVLLFSAALTVLGAGGGWFVADRAINLLTADVGVLHFKALTDAFMMKLRMALALGFLGVLPLVLHRVWRFIVPALLPHEKRALLPLVASSLALFYLGAGFALFVVKPLMVRFFLQFSIPGRLEPVIMVGDYLSLVARLALGFGVVFQLPVGIAVLSLAGLVDPASLARQWRAALVVIFIAAALFTPGTDVISQLALAGPLIVLFFGGVVVSKVLVGRAARREALESAAAKLGAGGRISP